jgi:hypothetical protein
MAGTEAAIEEAIRPKVVTNVFIVLNQNLIMIIFGIKHS